MNIGTWLRITPGQRIILLIALMLMGTIEAREAKAQSFFASPVVDPGVGADRGSASQIRKLEENTGFLTFSTTGSDDAGRIVLGFGYALPSLAMDGDQLDLVAIWAGPSEDGWRELLAGGIAYRFPLGGPDLTGFVNLDGGDLILGTEQALAFDARGDRVQLAAGLYKELDLGETARLKFGAELIARRTQSEILGNPAIDENLRMLRGSMLYSKGIPFIFQQRLALSFTKGFDAFGASQTGNPAGSVPGAQTDFLKVSTAAEVSLPLSPDWVLNSGLVAQWTDNSLPASQRCGFETNSYARAFDYAVVAGDRCLMSRVEIAYNFKRPDLRAGKIDSTQGFVGIDGGRITNLSNAISAGSSDNWSSLSLGVRLLQGSLLAEIAATRILDRPTVAATQDRDRLWLRAALQF